MKIEAERLLAALGFIASHVPPQERRAAYRTARKEPSELEQLERAGRILGLDLARYPVEKEPLQWALENGRVLLHHEDSLLCVEFLRKDKIQVWSYETESTTCESLSSFVAIYGSGTLIVPVAHRPLAGLASNELPTPTPVRRLLRYASLEKRDLLTVGIYAVGVGVLSLATPVAVQTVLNTVAFRTVHQQLITVVLLFAGALSISAVLRVFEQLVAEHVSRRLFVKSALDFASRLPLVDRARLQGRDLREVANRFFDAAIAEKTLGILILDGFTAILQITAGLVLLAFYHPFLLAFVAVLVICISAVALGLGRNAVRTAMMESKGKYAIAAWLEELAQSSTGFGWHVAERLGLDRARDLTGRWLSAREAHFRVHFRQFVGFLALQTGAGVLLLLVGGLLVMKEQLTFGQLVAAELVMTMTVGSLAKLGKLLPKLYDLLASLDKLGQILDLPLVREVGDPLPEDGDGIELVYNTPGLSFSLPAGGRASVCVPATSSAAAVSQAILGVRSPKLGTVELAGIEASALAASSVRANVMVLSAESIICGTILENITFGDLEFDDASVRTALAQVELLDDVRAMEDGLETQIDHAGHPLNPAQRARLLVARALIHRPRLLIVESLGDTLSEHVHARMHKELSVSTNPWTLLWLRGDPVPPVGESTMDPSAGGLAVVP